MDTQFRATVTTSKPRIGRRLYVNPPPTNVILGGYEHSTNTETENGRPTTGRRLFIPQPSSNVAIGINGTNVDEVCIFLSF